MKIRIGFVSNSSSSSFCIMGIVLNEEQRERDYYNEKELSEEYGIAEYYEERLLGMSPSKMKDDETLAQFKGRIVAEMKKVGLEVTVDDLSWHTDGGRDG